MQRLRLGCLCLNLIAGIFPSHQSECNGIVGYEDADQLRSASLVNNRQLNVECHMGKHPIPISPAAPSGKIQARRGCPGDLPPEAASIDRLVIHEVPNLPMVCFDRLLAPSSLGAYSLHSSLAFKGLQLVFMLQALHAFGVYPQAFTT